MENQNIQNPEESLRIITEMIEKTKKHYSNDSFYFILWGWLVLLASLAQYFLIPIAPEMSSLVWLLMPLGGIASVLHGRKQSRERRVKTQLESFISYLWMSLGLAMVVVLISMFSFPAPFVLPVFILLYALGTFLTGALLQFNPLKIGGLICFAISTAAFFAGMREQLLFIACAVLISYLIPGYLLKKARTHYGTQGA